MQTVQVSIPANLIEAVREFVEAEIKYWEELSPSSSGEAKAAQAKLAEYRALLKNLEGK